MRPSFHHRLINGPFDDPGLLVTLTFHKQALLFDLGDLSAVVPGDLLKIDRIFVSHTHMDHFIGFDQVLRLMLGRGKKLFLYGPEGFLNHVAGKLAGYTWNLVQNYTEALVIEANEILEDKMVTQTFDCRSGFSAGPARAAPLVEGTLYQEPAMRVRATILDHQIPCLAFALQEHFHVNILKTQLDDLGLSVGPWLNAFKAMLHREADPATEIRAPSASAEGAERIFTLEALSARIARITRGQKIAYVTDVLYSPANAERIIDLARDADHLFIEAAFLHNDLAAAQAKHHLTARQAGLLARKAHVKQFTVFHHSPRYLDQAELLNAEARRAFEEEAQT